MACYDAYWGLVSGSFSGFMICRKGSVKNNIELEERFVIIP